VSRNRTRPRSPFNRLTAAAIATAACVCVSATPADATGTDTEPVVSRVATIFGSVIRSGHQRCWPVPLRHRSSQWAA
jgi:hypothetical protein